MSDTLVQFVGGIGDALLSIYQSDNYTFLDDLEADARVHVDCVMGNPRLHELFKWHPKRSQLTITSHDLEFPIDDEVLRKWGLPTNRRKYFSHGVIPSAEVVKRVRWNISPDVLERRIVKRLHHGPPYAAFSVSAGHPTRNIPIELAVEAKRICSLNGLRVVQIGSTYEITSPLMRCVREEPRIGADIDLIDRTSVPGSLEIIDNAKILFTCHTSSLIEAWFRRKPAYLVYPDCMESYAANPGERFNFGWQFPEFSCSTIGKWNASDFDSFVKRYR